MGFDAFLNDGSEVAQNMLMSACRHTRAQASIIAALPRHFFNLLHGVLHVLCCKESTLDGRPGLTT